MIGAIIAIDYAEGAQPIIAAAEGIADGQRVSFAIRPEKIAVGTEPDPSRTNRVQGKIIDIGYLGNVSTYHLELPGGQKFSAQMTNARRLARRDFTWDDEVWLSWTETAGVVLTE